MKQIIKETQELKLYHNDFLENIKDIDKTLITQSVHMHLQNRRQGTVMCKDRSLLVSRSNKKPWKQKGTGRARAGSARSPLWRGGGIALGPVPRVKTLALTRKMRHLSCQGILKNKIKSQMVAELFFVAEDIIKGSCKKAFTFLKNNDLHKKKMVLLYNNEDKNTYYSFSNINNVLLVSYDSIFPYILADSSCIIFLKKDRDLFEKVINTWKI